MGVALLALAAAGLVVFWSFAPGRHDWSYGAHPSRRVLMPVPTCGDRLPPLDVEHLDVLRMVLSPDGSNFEVTVRNRSTVAVRVAPLPAAVIVDDRLVVRSRGLLSRVFVPGQLVAAGETVVLSSPTPPAVADCRQPVSHDGVAVPAGVYEFVFMIKAGAGSYRASPPVSVAVDSAGRLLPPSGVVLPFRS